MGANSRTWSRKGCGASSKRSTDTTRERRLAGLMRHALGVVEFGVPTLDRALITSRASGAMQAIVDTGPLVAFFDRSERHHQWVADRIEPLAAPLLVCEPVLTESTCLLARFPKAQDALFSLLQNGALVVAFRLEEHIAALQRLLHKYRDTPMSLADACVVRMAEIHENRAVLTLDSDFTVYRKHGRGPITLMHPA